MQMRRIQAGGTTWRIYGASTIRVLSTTDGLGYWADFPDGGATTHRALVLGVTDEGEYWVEVRDAEGKLVHRDHLEADCAAHAAGLAVCRVFQQLLTKAHLAYDDAGGGLGGKWAEVTIRDPRGDGRLLTVVVEDGLEVLVNSSHHVNVTLDGEFYSERPVIQVLRERKPTSKDIIAEKSFGGPNSPLPFLDGPDPTYPVSPDRALRRRYE